MTTSDERQYMAADLTCDLLTCTLCGHQFAPEGNAACGSCPLHSGCRLVCCPGCGHTTVDPSKSQLVSFGTRLLGLFGARKAPAGRSAAPGARAPSLADVPAGQRVRLAEFGALTAAQRELLQSYGLLPGSLVRVVQHTPATVIQIDHSELAFEAEIAREILVAHEEEKD